MTIYGWDACCRTGCPCAADGAHKGNPVISAKYDGARFCCRRSYVRLHYQDNRQVAIDRAVIWNRNNPERRRVIESARYRKTEAGRRDYHLQAEFGLTLQQYDEMVLTQCGACAVCGESERAVYKATGEPKRLAVHHDHQTGRVVALLCQSCNRGMGFLGDSPARLRRAADLHEEVTR